MIVCNKAKCTICNDVIESVHRHDFVTCSCGNFSVDGGLDYLKRSAKDMNQFVEMSEFQEKCNVCGAMESENVELFGMLYGKECGCSMCFGVTYIPEWMEDKSEKLRW